MGFISGAFDKSVFNKGSYAAAIGKPGKKNGYAVVRITPTIARNGENELDSTITGVLNSDQGGFNFNIEANWEPMGGFAQSVLPDALSKLSPLYDNVNALAQLGGNAKMGVSYASKLIYQQSGYLTINIPLMIADWRGIGQPLMSAMLLSYYMLPSKNKNNINQKDTISNLTTWLKEQLKNNKVDSAAATVLKNLLVGSAGFVEGAALDFGALAKKYNDQIVSFDKSGTLAAGEATAAASFGTGVSNGVGGINDMYTLRSSPSPVQVEIGEYFKNTDMVITNIKFEFSKEITRMGPLFLKVDLALSTRQIMVGIDDTGLIPIATQSRYLQAGGNLKGQ